MSILDFPIPDNMGPVLELVDDDEEQLAKFLDEGPVVFGEFKLEDLQIEDVAFAWGYLRGLGDAWNMTATQVWEEWQHMDQVRRARL